MARKGAIVEHHFAHLAGHPTCEGWWHATVKHLVCQQIADALATNAEMPIVWDCENVPPLHNHALDLLGKGKLTNVYAEKHIPEYNIRPDITLTAGDIPAVLIEIVDTHKPEQPRH